MFELHVYQNKMWKKLETFDERQDAMSAAYEIERSKRCSGAKVFELVCDPQTADINKKLLHRWSAEDANRAVQQEVDENLDRQRQLRRQIRARQKAENKGWSKQVWNIVVVSSLPLILVSGLIGVLLMKFG